MEVLEAISTRRSIRKFTGQPVNEDDLHTILRAGCYAPSARNRQPFITAYENDQGTAPFTFEYPPGWDDRPWT